MGRRRRSPTKEATSLVVLLLVGILTVAVPSVLRPHIDRPTHVDGIVVVAGTLDDRYVYARSLAEEGRADQILVSRPAGLDIEVPSFAAEIDGQCAASPIHARDGRRIPITCFTPDFGKTRGEARAAARIARERGWHSMLVVTYWGHVSRVRHYFSQCFDGDVYVTDTPRPTQISKIHALTHETGGYIKALLKPGC